MGVRLRRRFGFHNGTLSSMEDEHLERGESLGLGSDLLREEIERPRVGPMRDIVATIQPDQDELVRADLDTSLCIQGAPGTGKTAVGLHRAAYLLYTYPDRLRRSGVLVVGPNAAFLHYIAQVLPSLGEGGITQRTVDGLIDWPARGTEAVPLAVLKGDHRLADVARRAVLSHVTKPTEDVVAIIGTRRYRIGAHHLRRYVDDARRALAGGLRWSTARERLRTQVAEDVRRQREDAGGAPSDAETRTVGPLPRGAGMAGRGVARAHRARAARPPLRRRRLPAPLLGDVADRRRARGAAPPGAEGAAHDPLDPRRRRAARRAGLAAGGQRHLRARRRRRGAGPVRDAVPGRRTALPARLADRARRPRAGHHAVGTRRLGAHAAPPRPRRRPGAAADRRLPRARRGARGRQPAAAAHRAGRSARGHPCARESTRCATCHKAALWTR